VPSKTRKAAAAQALPTIPKELIDQFVNGPIKAEAVIAASIVFKKALIERALGAELTHHLGCAPGGEKPVEASDHRNGFSACCRIDGSLLRQRADTAAVVKTGSPYTGADGIPGLRRVFVALAVACAGMSIYLGFSS
jgi:hypothetical protein